MNRDRMRRWSSIVSLSVIVVAASALAGGGGPACLDESFSFACDWAPQPANEDCPHEILVNGDCFKTFPAQSGFDTKQSSTVLCRYKIRRPLPEGGGCVTLEPPLDYTAACDRAVGKVCAPPEPPNP